MPPSHQIAAWRYARIEERLAAQLDAGLLDEVRGLRDRPGGLSRTARQALGYRELLAHLESGLPLDEAVAEAARRTKSFARRQWAWFRRDPRIMWLDRDGDLLGQLLSVWDGAAPGCRRAGAAPFRGTAPSGRLTTVATHMLTLTKHEACGNDFLVMVDLSDERPLDASEVRALCDRHRGIGADGVLRALRGPEGTDLTMELRNADGTVAEMSGNGIRCLVQAVVDEGLLGAGTVSVATLGGTRHVEYRADDRPGTGIARVDMGAPHLGAEFASGDVPAPWRGRAVDMGNPHLVLFGPPPRDEDLTSTGRRLAEQGTTGANVEFVWRQDRGDDVHMRVWERGVGETLSCGTGACAVVAALHDWGEVAAKAKVHSPGGTLLVEIGPSGAVLGGPTVRIGRVEIDEDILAGLVHAQAAVSLEPLSSDEVAISR